MQRIVKLSRWLALVSLVAFAVSFSGHAAADANSRYFPETGHTVTQPFLTYWNTHGALAQQGYPITDDYQEVNDADGHTYRTQYFQRSRFEYHPEQANPLYQVLLGLLGTEAFNAKYPGGLPPGTPTQVVPGGGSHTFPDTGHTVTGLFLSYWQTHGGLAQQGFPITEAYIETNDADGNQYITQYFQRARFEYHPEQSDPQYKVLLGLVGNEVYLRKHNGGGPTNTPMPGVPPTNTPAPAVPTSTPTNTPIPSAPATTQVLDQQSIAAAATGSATASCTAGSIVVSGGWASNTDLQVYNSSKQGNGWRVYAKNNSGSSQLLNSYAICLSGTSGSVTQEFAQKSLPNGASDSVAKACSSGVVTGGGFADNVGVFLYNTSPSGNGWEAAATNNTGSSQLLNAYAMCLNGTGATGQEVFHQVSVAAGAIGDATIACPSGSLVTGGGFAANSGEITYTSLKEGNGWHVYTKNTSASAGLLNVYAQCTTFP
ncbi:MAG: hypothetical protein DLM69_01615 [Candidatus Chloroheliales bacterium]|nr:MAG: hypothetical protein DLM69_01615 [Chloroflexota bacterium]